MSGIREREEHWQQELINAQALQTDSDAIWDQFWEKLQAVNRMYDYGMTLSLEQKKIILNALLDEFILIPDGHIELRYKLPVTDKQVRDTVASMLYDDREGGQGDRFTNKITWIPAGVYPVP